jgi:hypothetical protein
MLASTITTLFLLIIIPSAHNNLSGLFSAGNLPTVSALTSNNNSKSDNNNNLSYTTLNRTSPFATANVLTSNNNNNKTSSSPIFLNYDNPFWGIKIQYPSDWLVALHFISGVFITQFISPIQNSTEKFPATVSISIQSPPKNITTLNQYTNVAYKLLKLISKTVGIGFNITESNNSTTLGGTIPAFERVFTVQQHFLDKNLKIIPLDFKIIKLYGINANKVYMITFTAESSKYDSYLPVAQKMIDSFKIIPTGQTRNVGAANAGSSNSSNSNQTATTRFHSTFDTYILPGSAKGYGVYSERPNDNNSFITGETAELYLVPSGFAYKPIISNQSEKTSLYQTNFTANVLVFDKQGKQVLATQYKVPKIALNQKVPELYVTIPLSIPQNFPPGEYKVRYFIIDGTSGKNFEIDKNLNIIAPKLQISASS